MEPNTHRLTNQAHTSKHYQNQMDQQIKNPKKNKRMAKQNQSGRDKLASHLQNADTHQNHKHSHQLIRPLGKNLQTQNLDQRTPNNGKTSHKKTEHIPRR